MLDLWERTLVAVETGDLDSVATEIDWVIKHKLIERYSAKHDLALSSSRIAQIDLAYHDISRERGLFYLLQRRGQAERVASDLEIFQAKSVPPQTTRARLRGEFIRRGPGAAARLHRRLGAPQAQRPGPAHGAVQGPVPLRRRARGEAHRQHVSSLRVPGASLAGGSDAGCTGSPG